MRNSGPLFTLLRLLLRRLRIANVSSGSGVAIHKNRQVDKKANSPVTRPELDQKHNTMVWERQTI
jgi:hypothetical protein